MKLNKNSTSIIHIPCKNSHVKIEASISVMAPDGDEEVCGLFRCSKCDGFFIDCYHDEFMSNDSGFTYQIELSSKNYESLRQLINRCPTANNKICRCTYHNKFSEWLYRGFKEYMSDKILDENLLK